MIRNGPASAETPSMQRHSRDEPPVNARSCTLRTSVYTFFLPSVARKSMWWPSLVCCSSAVSAASLVFRFFPPVNVAKQNVNGYLVPQSTRRLASLGCDSDVARCFGREEQLL